MSEKDKIVELLKNKKAYFQYSVVESIEAGIVLLGTEVKSIRNRNANFQDSFAKLKNGEVYLVNLHIGKYKHGNINNHEPLRERKLLLTKREIRRLTGKVKEKGLTLVPLSFYLKNGLIKVKLGLCKGKKLYDKREAIAQRDTKRDVERQMKDY